MYKNTFMETSRLLFTQVSEYNGPFQLKHKINHHTQCLISPYFALGNLSNILIQLFLSMSVSSPLCEHIINFSLLSLLALPSLWFWTSKFLCNFSFLVQYVPDGFEKNCEFEANIVQVGSNVSFNSISWDGIQMSALSVKIPSMFLCIRSTCCCHLQHRLHDVHPLHFA